MSMVRSALGRASREMTDEIARRCGCSSSTKGKKEQHLLSMMTPPLSSMVMAEQIHNNMWERNGRGVMRGESVRAAAAFRVCFCLFFDFYFNSYSYFYFLISRSNTNFHYHKQSHDTTLITPPPTSPTLQVNLKTTGKELVSCPYFVIQTFDAISSARLSWIRVSLSSTHWTSSSCFRTYRRKTKQIPATMRTTTTTTTTRT